MKRNFPNITNIQKSTTNTKPSDRAAGAPSDPTHRTTVQHHTIQWFIRSHSAPGLQSHSTPGLQSHSAPGLQTTTSADAPETTQYALGTTQYPAPTVFSSGCTQMCVYLNHTFDYIGYCSSMWRRHQLQQRPWRPFRRDGNTAARRPSGAPPPPPPPPRYSENWQRALPEPTARRTMQAAPDRTAFLLGLLRGSQQQRSSDFSRSSTRRGLSRAPPAQAVPVVRLRLPAVAE
jgi:hypothetical protein